MTESVFNYIKILLPLHRCVTLPGLGAFILNDGKWGAFGTVPPHCDVSFNRDLQHNDGVLLSYIQNLSGDSYEKIRKNIFYAVNSIKADLQLNKKVLCGSLGHLEMIEGNLIFKQSPNFIFPGFFGLSNVKLNHLSEISKTQDKQKSSISLTRKIVVLSACVATLLLLTLPSISITDNAIPSNNQQAGYLSSLIASTKATSSTIRETTITDLGGINNDYASHITSETQEVNPIGLSVAEENITAKGISNRVYYLIIAGESTSRQAQLSLNKIMEQGFNSAKILESSNRHRIYIASFDDKKEAVDYLVAFKKNYPQYESAWIHSQRN